MANQIIVIALILVAIVGIASAGTAAPSLAPAAASGGGNDNDLSEGPTGADYSSSEGPTGESNDDTVGTISGGGAASDAAPVGGPVPNGVFADLTPTAEPAPVSDGATALGVTAVVAAGVIGSLFL